MSTNLLSAAVVIGALRVKKLSGLFYFYSSFLELDDTVIESMMDLVFELLCQGDLMLARILRRKIIEKCEAKKHHIEVGAQVTLLSSLSVTSK